MQKLSVYLFLFFFTIGNSQNRTLDSLFNLLKKETSKTKKGELYSELAFNLMSFDLDTAMAYVQKAFVISKSSQNNYGIAKASLAQGQIFIRKGEYDSAIIILNSAVPLIKSSKVSELYKYFIALGVAYTEISENAKALDYYNQSLSIIDTNDIKTKAIIYGNMGNIYASVGDYNKALQVIMKALKLNEQTGGKNKIAYNLHGIATIQVNQRNYRSAISSFNKSIEIKIQEGEKIKLWSSYMGIGMPYLFLNQYDSALYYFNESRKIAKNIGNNFNEASSLINIGLVYDGMGDNKKALETYFEALGYFKKEEVSDKIALCLNNIASIYIEEKKYKEAIKVATEGLEFGKQAQTKESIKDSYGILNKAFVGIGDYKSANENGNLSALMQDSILNEKVTLQLTEMQVKYDTEKKESENKVLSQQNQIQSLQLNQNKFFIIGLGILLLLVLLVAYLLFRQNKFSNQQREIQLEQKLLRSQMNPHFLFNSLNSIHSVVLSGDSKTAAKYLASFSKLVRAILESSRFETITLEKEISSLRNYIDLQILRFENNIQYTIDVSDNIDPERILLPPMLTQPFIENALEHGLANITDALLIISFKNENGFLIVEVTDNGSGLGEIKNTTEHTSMATEITKERLTLLNRGKSKKTVFSISEAFPTNNDHKGVKVTFQIPI